MNPEVTTALRAVLIAIGGIGVGHNWIDGTELETIVSAVMILVGGVWAWWSNRPKSGEAQKVAERVAMDPSVAPNIVKLEPGQVVTESQAIGRRATDITQPPNP